MASFDNKEQDRQGKVAALVKRIKDTDENFYFNDSQLKVHYSKDGQTSFVATDNIAMNTLLLNTSELEPSYEVRDGFASIEDLAKEMAGIVFDKELFFSESILPDFGLEDWEEVYKFYILFTLTILVEHNPNDVYSGLLMDNQDQKLLVDYLNSWPINDNEFHSTFPFCWSPLEKVDEKIHKIEATIEDKTVTELKTNIEVLNTIATSVVKPILEKHIRIENIEDATSFNSDIAKIFKYVFSNVESRAFGVDECAFVPFFDLVNGSPEFADAENAMEQFLCSKNSHQLIATREILKGEQIIINYGDLSADELLVKYGFVWEM